MNKIKPTLLFAMALAFACSKSNAPKLTGRWIDLTHEFSSATIYWPTSETFKLDSVFAGITDKGFYYAANNFRAAEHGGTHLDSPIHFAAGRMTVDQIPLEQLIAPAVVIDVSEKAQANRDYQVTTEDFTAWESQHQKIPDNSIVLLRTGYHRFWPDRLRYLGTDKRGQEGVSALHFPGLHPEAARWLVANRKINAIGLDTPSIDYGQSQLFESHQILFDKNIPAFENVANLDQLPAMGALVFALPMKIKGGSGGPLRIVALVSNEK
ncbi:MAG: cyclase family protein [candidate division KSB1 bacterium]|nr:cyclase family protein [candidate division KSB1 bacterium]